MGFDCIYSWSLPFCVYYSFPFSFEGGTWGLIVFTPDHCLSTYFPNVCQSNIDEVYNMHYDDD